MSILPPYKPEEFNTPEFRRPTPAPAPKPAERASEYITISVAEYHFLTKAAAHLEVILADKTYGHEAVVAAVRNAMEDMKRMAGEGAAK